jgi:hypothetical protein
VACLHSNAQPTATVPTQPGLHSARGPRSGRGWPAHAAGSRPSARQARGRAHGGSRVEARACMGTTERQRIIGRRRHGATNSAGGGGSAVRRDTPRRRELSGYARGGGGALRPDGYSDSPSSKDHRGRDGGARLRRGERR